MITIMTKCTNLNNPLFPPSKHSTHSKHPNTASSKYTKYYTDPPKSLKRLVFQLFWQGIIFISNFVLNYSQKGYHLYFTKRNMLFSAPLTPHTSYIPIFLIFFQKIPIISIKNISAIYCIPCFSDIFLSFEFQVSNYKYSVVVFLIGQIRNFPIENM